MEELNDLYQEIILEHSKKPENQRHMECPTCSAEGYNPLCGDEITLYLNSDGKRILDISFTGQGCAISRASASMMTLKIKNKTKEEAQQILQQVLHWVNGHTESIQGEALGDLAALAGVKKFPARIKCATLAWHALQSALDKLR